MEVFKYEMEVIMCYTYAELIETVKNLNVSLYLTREMKDDYITIGDTFEAIEQEKTILILCENLETVESVMATQELSVFNEYDMNSYCLN